MKPGNLKVAVTGELENRECSGGIYASRFREPEGFLYIVRGITPFVAEAFSLQKPAILLIPVP
jgi:hypothetical protein